ncbi:unnamed protein product [Pieris brassicae]|uniref:Uncharacterized protein n=1 Tax=Pieris brassicae TaxID=7116 RepID=A0A9P0TP70_PIEBR|nr:unnamed protein product [Pieris brassicae]
MSCPLKGLPDRTPYCTQPPPPVPLDTRKPADQLEQLQNHHHLEVLVAGSTGTIITHCLRATACKRSCPQIYALHHPPPQIWYPEPHLKHPTFQQPAPPRLQRQPGER